MRLIKYLTILIGTALLLAMCGNPAKQASEPQEKFIDFKSAILTREVSSGPFTVTTVDYIDNYGDIWYQYSSRNDGSGKTMATCIDGYDYVCFLDNKTGMKSKRSEEQDLNWLNLTDESKQYYQIEYLGQEEYIGKMCDVYSMVEKLDETPAKYWIWKGLPLKIEVQMSGAVMVTNTVDLKTDVEIPADCITLPEDVVLETID